MVKSQERLETILVVDDTNIVLESIVAVLKNAKYNVLQADSGQNALAVAAEHVGPIDLLLSDVKMPGMSGPDLGAQMKQTRSDLHVMFMSSFPGGDLLVLNYGWAFIDKPFVAAKLLEMVDVVLHSPDKSQGSHQYDTRIESGKE
jgi:two-component system cell cycle sensor histidine kinase/response regulator CckA